MKVALHLDDAPLRRRVIRSLASFPDVIIDADAPRSASIGGEDIALSADPVGHLAELLAAEVAGRSGAPASTRAATIDDTPLTRGIAVAFPPPVGSLWAEAVGGVLRAPVTSSYSAALASNERLALAVVDDSRFLVALVTAAPILAAARGIAVLEAAIMAGLSVAERG